MSTILAAFTYQHQNMENYFFFIDFHNLISMPSIPFPLYLKYPIQFKDIKSYQVGSKSTLTLSNCNICKICQKFAVSAIFQVCWKAAGCRMRNGVCAHKSDNAPKVTFEISWSLRSINWSLWSFWSSMDISHQSDIVLKVSSWSSLAINRPRSFLYILS